MVEVIGEALFGIGKLAPESLNRQKVLPKLGAIEVFAFVEIFPYFSIAIFKFKGYCCVGFLLEHERLNGLIEYGEVRADAGLGSIFAQDSIGEGIEGGYIGSLGHLGFGLQSRTHVPIHEREGRCIGLGLIVQVFSYPLPHLPGRIVSKGKDNHIGDRDVASQDLSQDPK